MLQNFYFSRRKRGPDTFETTKVDEYYVGLLKMLKIQL